MDLKEIGCNEVDWIELLNIGTGCNVMDWIELAEDSDKFHYQNSTLAVAGTDCAIEVWSVPEH
uniref:Uncharacterized protein n=1 Tax=Timema tahoe TaxID=61484 RepID=A0A7R9NWY5_9NEOP|nr:unnamed protein product [Timema tahoe]